MQAIESVFVATIDNISLYGEQIIDGFLVEQDNRVLVRNQANPEQNGVYVASFSTWYRPYDMDEWGNFPASFVMVEQGNRYIDTGWLCTVDYGGTLETDPITFIQFSTEGTIQIGERYDGDPISVDVNRTMDISFDRHKEYIFDGKSKINIIVKDIEYEPSSHMQRSVDKLRDTNEHLNENTIMLNDLKGKVKITGFIPDGENLQQYLYKPKKDVYIFMYQQLYKLQIYELNIEKNRQPRYLYSGYSHHTELTFDREIITFSIIGEASEAISINGLDNKSFVIPDFMPDVNIEKPLEITEKPI